MRGPIKAHDEEMPPTKTAKPPIDHQMMASPRWFGWRVIEKMPSVFSCPGPLVFLNSRSSISPLCSIIIPIQYVAISKAVPISWFVDSELSVLPSEIRDKIGSATRTSKIPCKRNTCRKLTHHQFFPADSIMRTYRISSPRFFVR